MASETLTTEEKQLVKRCLIAASEGPFFPDGEFGIIMGCERQEMADVASAYPEVDEYDTATRCAINNALLWLRSYPHEKHELLKSDYTLVEADEIARVFMKWRGDQPKNFLDLLE